MKILIIDNYDSFIYNIVQFIDELGYTNLRVALNDKITLEEVAEYDKIILSPGPGVPSEANIVMPLIEKYAPTKSILGICLGEQAIAQAFGAKLTNMKDVFHGVSTTIDIIAEDPIFRGLPPQIEVGRYHSWVVSSDDFPTEELVVTACDKEGSIMALAHKHYDVRGVQFHPESILTPQGKKIIENWLLG